MINKPFYPEAWIALGRRIFLQACKDMLGMDGVPAKRRREAAEWLLTPEADLFAGQARAGRMAWESITEDPAGVRQRFLDTLQAIRAEEDSTTSYLPY